jgi:hypothetical protein
LQGFAFGGEFDHFEFKQITLLVETHGHVEAAVLGGISQGDVQAEADNLCMVGGNPANQTTTGASRPDPIWRPNETCLRKRQGITLEFYDLGSTAS